MNTTQYEAMMEGLLTTAQEKFYIAGVEAIQDVEAIKKLIVDMECFWNGDGDLSDTDWEVEIDMVIYNNTI